MPFIPMAEARGFSAQFGKTRLEQESSALLTVNALGFEGLVNTSCNSDLTFVPLTSEYKVQGKLIWKKYQLLAQAPRLFLDRVRSDLQQ